MADSTLYERLGGVFAIAAVVDHFSDALIRTRSSARARRIRLSANGTPTASRAPWAEVHADPLGLRRLWRSATLGDAAWQDGARPRGGA